MEAEEEEGGVAIHGLQTFASQQNKFVCQLLGWTLA